MPLKRRVPKRGFHNPFSVEYAVVNLDTLGERFDAGTVVTLDLLRERRLVPPSAKRVKVLGRGEIAKALTVRVHKFSGEAAKKIAAAGGAAETLERGKRSSGRDVKVYGYRQRQEPVRHRRAAQARAVHARAAHRVSHRRPHHRFPA